MNATDWALVLTGAFVGGADEFITNWGHDLPCWADWAAIIQSAYFIYMYMHEFVRTDDSQDIAFASLYVAYGSTPVIENRCWITAPHGPYALAQSPQVSAIEENLLDRLYYANARTMTLHVFLEGLEVLLDVYTFLDMRHQLNFVNAGIAAGKGIVNAIFYVFFVVLSIVKHYQDDDKLL